MPSISVLSRVHRTRPRPGTSFWANYVPLPLSLASVIVLGVATLFLVSLTVVLALSSSPDSAVLRAALLLALVPIAVATAPLIAWDLKRRLLPNRIVLPLFVPAVVGLAVASVVLGDLSRLWAALGIALLVGFVLLLMMLIPGQHLGGGDLKLFVLLLLVSAWWSPLLAAGGFILATIVAAFWAVALRVCRGESSIPFGPALLAGFFAAATIAAL